MAGGIWTSQNKTRPGAYINFKGYQPTSMMTGNRGVVAMGVPLDWGKEGELIEVTSSELLDGNSIKKIGFDAFNAKAKLVAGALSYCSTALVYRFDVGGTKATATIGNLKVTAKYNGILGNKIIIAIKKRDTSEIYRVTTYLDGEVVDTQDIYELNELESNEYCDFEIVESTPADLTEPAETNEIIETAGTSLIGGSNGTVTEEIAYQSLMNVLKFANWNTLACFSSNLTTKSNIVSFIQSLRDEEGKYVQAVVADYPACDYEGVINSVSSLVIDGVTFTKEEFVCIVAGMTAGASYNESNTSRVITGAEKIISESNDIEIKTAIEQGKFIITTSSSGKIKVEQDINSLHTFTKTKPYDFSKNRVIRVLDEIGNTTKITWEDTYMGKVDNTSTGRALFKADLISYANELQRISAIQEFDGTVDIEVMQGRDVDSVVSNWAVKPVDSMEKLYMTVNLRS